MTNPSKYVIVGADRKKEALDMIRTGKENAMMSRSFVLAYNKREQLEALTIYQSFSLLCLYKMEREWKQMPPPEAAG